MWIAVASGLVLSAAAPALVRLMPRGGPRFLALGPAALAVFFADGLRRASGGPPLLESWAWYPDLGVRLAFRGDALAFFFGVLVAGIGSVVVLYSGAYLRGDPRLGRFLAVLLAFMASMLGLVFADDVITLAVAWGLTGLWSFFLIGHAHGREQARKAALQALLVTELGSLALLVGLVLMADAGGTSRISELDGLQAHPGYPAVLALVLAGAFTKSAQWPFHVWLPNAMEAPTPASAYLHAATMVKAGVYLLLRFHPILGGTAAWTAVLGAAGGITLVAGAALALRESDLKRILAYTTVASLGAAVLLVGIGTTAALSAAVVYLGAHALYKGALFLVAGIVDHETGTRDVERLGGLARAMPATAVVAALAGLSMASLPPALGYLGKEMFYDATAHAPSWTAALTAASVVGNTILFAATLVLVLRPFTGGAPRPGRPHDPSMEFWVGPALLAGAGLAGGLFPGAIGAWAAPVAEAAAARPVELRLALWHGWTTPFVLSLATAAAGLGAFAARPLLKRVPPAAWGPDRLYDAAFAGVNRLATWQTRVLQHGSLPGYLSTVLTAAAVLAGGAMLADALFAAPAVPFDGPIFELAIVGVMAGAAGAAVFLRSLPASVVAMGTVGYGISLLFLLHGAPDLALTQLIVESLTVIFFVLVLRGIPRSRNGDAPPSRPGGAAAAVAVGAVMTSVLLAVLAAPADDRPASRYFVEASVPEGRGRNVVNVILVDFRAIDTLGEITVLAVAAGGAFSLLRLASPRREESP